MLIIINYHKMPPPKNRKPYHKGPQLKKLCLNMIVKNESNNLPRLFASLYKLIDYYIICDTGSEDDTIEVIKREMGKYGIPGEIHEDPWENFGHNRQLSLERAVGKAKYVLIIDADETLTYTDPDFSNKLTDAVYNIEKRLENTAFFVPHILNLEDNNKWGWCWKGVVHNYLEAANYKEPGFKKTLLKGITITARCEGGKSKGLTEHEKYMKDVLAFEKELIKDPKDARSRFYLAQSYKDAKEHEKSIENYWLRIAMKGWVEEVYYSYLMIGEQMRALNKPFEEWGPVYLEAYNVLPTRMEALYFIVDHYRREGKYHLGHLYGKIGSKIKKPETGLFLIDNIYNYLMYDSYAVCSYWAGDYDDSANLCRRLLRDGKMPEENRARIKENLDFTMKKLKDIKKGR